MDFFCFFLPYLLPKASLVPGVTENVSLSLMFEKGIRVLFSVNGPGVVHISGRRLFDGEYGDYGEEEGAQNAAMNPMESAEPYLGELDDDSDSDSEEIVRIDSNGNKKREMPQEEEESDSSESDPKPKVVFKVIIIVLLLLLFVYFFFFKAKRRGRVVFFRGGGEEASSSCQGR
jgi:hypothetical protein